MQVQLLSDWLATNTLPRTPQPYDYKPLIPAHFLITVDG